MGAVHDDASAMNKIRDSGGITCFIFSDFGSEPVTETKVMLKSPTSEKKGVFTVTWRTPLISETNQKNSIKLSRP